MTWHLWSVLLTVQHTNHTSFHIIVLVNKSKVHVCATAAHWYHIWYAFGFQSSLSTVWQQLIYCMLRCYWATQPQSVVCWLYPLRVISLRCIVFGCWVLWVRFNSDSLPILQSLSSGRTGKMVKKVCPCNQLCSNYLSFWSFLPPCILLHLCSLMLPPTFWCLVDLNFDSFWQIGNQIKSVISAIMSKINVIVWLLIFWCRYFW